MWFKSSYIHPCANFSGRGAALPKCWRHWILAFLGLSIFSGSHSQDGDLKQVFNAYSGSHLQEKIYLHSDKTLYLAGETCWFKLYNVDGMFNRPIGMSRVAYVELLQRNGKAVVQTKISLSDGSGNGTIQLPVGLESGGYLLRAYTSWMKNFSQDYYFQMPITILNPVRYDASLQSAEEKYDVQFFPEGGNLVNDLPGRIAFRTVDHGGLGVSCTGAIVDETGDTVSHFQPLVFGLGSFALTPHRGHNYKAVLSFPSGLKLVKELPAAYENGYTMRVNRSENGNWEVLVGTHGLPAPENMVYLFVQTRGSVKAVLTAGLNQGTASFTINRETAGEGVSQLTLFNSERQPVCERLVFKRPENIFSLAMTTDKPTYEQRSKVSLQIKSADHNLATAADLSLSVYRLDSLTRPNQLDITSYCWLKSELVGNIESPSWYFTQRGDSADQAADNLMMTQGWRRFRWEEIVQKKTPLFRFAPELKGPIVQGRLLSNTTGQPVSSVECFLSVPSTRSQFRTSFSDDSGRVRFEMPDFVGNGEIVLQYRGQEDSLAEKYHFEIESPFSATASPSIAPFSWKPGRLTADISGNHLAVQVQHAFASDKQLRFAWPAIDTLPFYVTPDASYMLDNYVRFTTVEEILREYVPYVNVKRRDGHYILPTFDRASTYFFQGNPLILLDGVVVQNPDKIMSYDPLKIKKLEVVSRMYFYGKMVFWGIVNFSTYNGDIPGFELDAHAVVVDYETVQLQREFFSPVYESADPLAGRMADYRRLLYWSPSIRTGSDGVAQAIFYTSDVGGQFLAQIEGITKDGKTASQQIFFQVAEKPVQHSVIQGGGR